MLLNTCKHGHTVSIGTLYLVDLCSWFGLGLLMLSLCCYSFVYFLEYVVLFLDDNVDEKTEEFSSS